MKLRILSMCLASVGLLGLASVSDLAFEPAGDAGLSTAICPVVYPLDEWSSERGYHYIFYGNAFFIDKDGYLITAAHVLSDFHDGAPPGLLKVEVVSSDSEHDIAVLQVVPNPFQGRFRVSYLRLAAEKPLLGAGVLAAALRPSRLNDPHSFDAPVEDQSPAEVLEFISTSLSKGQAQVELFLFSHEVIYGQSGAPVVSRGGPEEVVGVVEGRWLHPRLTAAAHAVGDSSWTLGAAIPITYAIPLLEEKHISWQTASLPAAPN